MDRKTKVTDAQGNITAFVFNVGGELTQEKRGVGTSLEQLYAAYTYTLNGQKLSITDARGNTQGTFSYDGHDRLDKTTYADATYEENVAYDLNGNLLKGLTREGRFIAFTYDQLDRKLTEHGLWTDGTSATLSHEAWRMHDATFTYDAAGRMLTASTDEQTRTWSYDSAGRPLNHVRSQGGTFAYAYDAASNLTGLTYPDGKAAAYAYDGLNRMTLAQLKTSPTGTVMGSATLAYDTLSRRTGVTFGDTSTQAYAWEADNDLASIAHTFPGATGDNVSYGYTYDKAHRQISETISNTAYVYDPTAATQSYGAAAAVNSYPSVAGTSFTYWSDGSINSDGVRSYQYDEKKNLKAVFAAGSSTDFEANKNDALGERFWAERDPATGTPTGSLLLSDGLSPEVSAEQVQTKSGGAWSATGWRDYVLGASPDERLIYLDESGIVRYPHTDKHSSTVALAYTGTAQSKFKFGPFGESADSPSGYAWRYTGQHIDAWTGLYWYKAREYSPGLGRFIQADPAGFVDGPNLYAYVGNDPEDKSDPTGLLSPSELQIVKNNKLGGPAEALYDGPSVRPGVGGQIARKIGLLSSAFLIDKILHQLTEGRETVRYLVYRGHGGPADTFSKSDAITGTFFTLMDPRALKTKEAVRQTWAILPQWNDLSQVAVGWVDKRDITSWGLSVAQVEKSGKTYHGGGIEIVVKNAAQKVKIIENGPSHLQ